jgi:catechol 2,3-dioxygenase-like lactoylglutathione lyase family enzyme
VVADAARGVAERGYRAAWTPNMRILEPFDDADAWAAELVDEAPDVSAADGCFAVPDRPGLGLRLDHEVCAAYPRTGVRIELVEPGWALRGQPDQSLTWRQLLGDHGVMDVLSSRMLLRPTDPERSRVFYRDPLRLAVYRETGSGPERGTVFFLGGGFLELSGRAAAPPAPGVALWLQVRDLAATRQALDERGVRTVREPRREPWGLLEMWIADPDGLRICVVEVPEEHPLRRRD